MIDNFGKPKKKTKILFGGHPKNRFIDNDYDDDGCCHFLVGN